MTITVSIHVPTRGTTYKSNSHYDWTLFQSTFPRGERRGGHVMWGARNHVSIHVPTRGTTPLGIPSPWMHGFQSTFPRGERPSPLISIHISSSVSIHVPTRGTTGVSLDQALRYWSFNPRSHEGNDQKNRSNTQKNLLFQSTFPRGERQHRPEKQKERKMFQSTFPRGERLCPEQYKGEWISSFNPRSHEGNDKLCNT